MNFEGVTVQPSLKLAKGESTDIEVAHADQLTLVNYNNAPELVRSALAKRHTYSCTHDDS